MIHSPLKMFCGRGDFVDEGWFEASMQRIRTIDSNQATKGKTKPDISFQYNISSINSFRQVALGVIRSLACKPNYLVLPWHVIHTSIQLKEHASDNEYLPGRGQLE